MARDFRTSTDKESGERAVVFGVLAEPEHNGGMPFPDGRHAIRVGFSAVEPTPDALNVNLDADGLAAYRT